MLGPDFFARDVVDVARALIGARLRIDGVGGTIVETEAYHHEDPAAHSFNGPTARNAAMFGPPGRAYIYRSYGLHWCLNFVCEGKGAGSAVLVRAIEPTAGVETMRERRGMSDVRLLCAGPGRLTQALAVSRSMDGLALDAPPFIIEAAIGEPDVIAGTRIGISRAVDLPWRFGLAGSRFLSRPFAGPRAGASGSRPQRS